MLNKGRRTIFFINMGGGMYLAHFSPPSQRGREREKEEEEEEEEEERLISGYHIEVSNPYLLES